MSKEKEEDLKPCINCGSKCKILAVQLGDVFTLKFLRVCNAECMFVISYDYIQKIRQHKDFIKWIGDRENGEDKKDREAHILDVTNIYRKSFERKLSTEVGRIE